MLTTDRRRHARLGIRPGGDEAQGLEPPSQLLAKLIAERRIGDSWKVSLEARGVFHVNPGDFDYQFRRDNLVRVDLAKYF